MRRCHTYSWLALALFALPRAGLAQAVPFDLQLQQGPGASHLSNGGTISMSTDGIGLSTSATLTVTYTGTLGVNFTAFQVTGSSAFTVSGVPNVPFPLGTTQNFVINIKYSPTTGAAATGQLLFSYTEGQQKGNITINLSGTVPDFIFSYVLGQNGNTIVLQPGANLPFPPTLLNTTAAATLAITNRGSGPGTVASIGVSGAEFAAAGLPLPNATVNAGGNLTFTVNFTPTQLGAAQGTLTIQLTQRQVMFALSGTGIGPVYNYSLAQTPLQPGQTISFPDTNVGQQSNLSLQIQNTGNAAGTISDISILGTGFQLTNLPFLPATIPAGGSLTFGLLFAPTQPGPITGRLRVGADNFTLAGTGLGAAMNYSYLVGGASTAVNGGGSVILSPVAVAMTGSTVFSITNSGTVSANISSIGVEGSGGIFSLPDLPPLPLTIAPGQTVSFSIVFAPNNVGLVTASLRVDTQTFTLSASGTSAVPLPNYRFTGPATTQPALAQVAASLTLASPYSLPLNGTLSLAFDAGGGPDDPAVQFAGGGRTVSFVIPANTTTAIFPNNATQVRLQTGSTSGSITLTPSFTTEAGLGLQPEAPAPLRLTIPSSAPQLLSAVLASKATNTFTLSLTGLATGRNITQLNFQFTPVGSYSLTIPPANVDVANAFTSWYQSATSQPFGSQFSATISFTLGGQVQGITNLVDSLQAVSVTLTNQQGVSNAIAVPLQ